MKREIMPINHHNKIVSNMIFGIAVIVISVVMLILILLKVIDYEGKLGVIDIFFALIFVLGGIASIFLGVESRNTSRDMLRKRSFMLSKEYVIGEIIDIENIKENFKGGENKYILVVKFTDIYTGNVKTIKSDPYREVLLVILKNNECKVYIDSTSSMYYIDGLNLRKSINDDILELRNDKYKSTRVMRNMGYLFLKYSSVIGVFIIAIFILVAYVISK